MIAGMRTGALLSKAESGGESPSVTGVLSPWRGKRSDTMPARYRVALKNVAQIILKKLANSAAAVHSISDFGFSECHGAS
jgi:hypothetical protein